MADSFRAIAASKRLAAAALEARFDHLTSGPPSPRKPKPQSLTKREQRDQDFRIACGAYVKGAQKAGAKLYADIQAAEKLTETCVAPETTEVLLRLEVVQQHHA